LNSNIISNVIFCLYPHPTFILKCLKSWSLHTTWF